jgi:hypothetical protein
MFVKTVYDYAFDAEIHTNIVMLRAAASQGGLELASLNWILASLMNHGFVISSSNDQRLRAAATEAGYLALEMRPLLPGDSLSLH